MGFLIFLLPQGHRVGSTENAAENYEYVDGDDPCASFDVLGKVKE